MDFSGHPILVTGATGWLGTNLVRALVSGLPEDDVFNKPLGTGRIRCLILPGDDPGALGELSPRVETVLGDLRRPADCDTFCQGTRGAYLFHLAGIVHPRRVSEFYRLNVAGSQNILNAAAAAGVRRAVVVSSNSPCGCNPRPDNRFNEESPYHPYRHYGRSKMLLEQITGSMARAGRIEAVIVRPPWFYGPHQPPRQKLFFQMIQNGTVPVVGGGENLRSMAYLDNLCQGLFRAALTERAGGRTYWIADERPYSMNEINATVRRLLREEFKQPCSDRIMALPGLVSEVALAVDTVLQSMNLYQQKIHVLSEMNKTIACDVSKAKNELGYAPRISLEEGMRRSLAEIYPRP